MTDVAGGMIDTLVVREGGCGFGPSQMAALRNSLPYMRMVMESSEIPNDVGIAIEYKIPATSKRIDFIITGKDKNKKPSLILVELKQWDKAEVTDMDGIVKTFVGGNTREVEHPSYQVWSYATLLEDYNSNVQDSNIMIEPCAYLHNYMEDDVINNEFYSEYTEKAPVFFKSDGEKLQNFIKKFVKYGDNKETLYLIENGKIKPSKALADSLAAMLKKNKKEFNLIDDQKLVYETALKLARESNETNKNVLIVEGGPGTGKSVVAINLLSELVKKQNVSYVTKNSAPRKVFQVKLTGVFTQTRIANLFRSSGSFYDVDPNTFDALIIDEAHRLNKKSGLFSHLGENQVKELIDAAKFTIFFIDENQRVTLKDIGKKSEIARCATELGVTIHSMELASQFRCNGSDGYLAWVDNALQIKETANDTLEGIDYDIKVADKLVDLHKEIIRKNEKNNKSRLVAGYCWKWISKNNPNEMDFNIRDFHARWNLNSHGQAWIIHPDSVKEIGCIHTCQGLELDYVGVIIGPDLIVRNGKIITDASKRASTDKSLHGYKKMLEEDPNMAKGMADMIIRNTYRTLMTRGMKGCYIYSTDPETQEYFKNLLQSNSSKKDNTYKNISDGASINTDL
jgi:DUF2075 family protein/DNA-binding XRE family transcriptional regulator